MFLAFAPPNIGFDWRPLVLLVNVAFTLWMLVDAVGSGQRQRWIPIILFPFGAWVYFFVVKVKDPHWMRRAPRPPKPPPLEVLRARATRAPSAANRLAFAWALRRVDREEEALAQFRAIFEEQPHELEAIDGAAQASAALGRLDDAIAMTERIVAREPGYDDHRAVLRLAAWWEEKGVMEQALGRLRVLCRRSGRLEHHLRLAEVLARAGKRREAHKVLTEAIGHWEAAPSYQKRAEARDAKTARRLLRELSAEA